MNPGSEIRYDYAKRVLDIVSALTLYVLTLPIQAVIAILIVSKLGRPALFLQSRPGKDGRIFTLMKFRTMANSTSETANVSEDASRLSVFGQKLRATSLDELPTLLNVVKGDMSMVGPRPLLVQYLGRYSPDQARRHEVRPGVTGLAQVKGRNAIGWKRKFELDIEYIDRRSAWLDFTILLLTVIAVVRRDGIAAEDHVTTREFMGTAETPDSE